jgi:hypothetical protein
MTLPASRLSAGLALAAPLLLLPMTCGGGEATAPAAAAIAQDPAPNAAPRVRLCLSGSMEGRLEPCGCAAGQLGGLPRRVFHLHRTTDYDLHIEGGNLIAGGTELDGQKLQTALTILAAARYAAIAVGPSDLALPLDELAAQYESWGVAPLAADLRAKDGAKVPFVSFSEHRLPEVVVRVVSLAMQLPEAVAGSLELLAPRDAWQRALAGAGEGDYRVLLAHGDRAAVTPLAALQPRPDLIVAITATEPEPPARAETVDGVPLVFPGIRGRMLLDVTLTRTAHGPQLTRYEVVRLEGSKTAKGALEDEQARAILDTHRHAVQAMGIREQMAERLPTPEGRTYVGNKVCADCHEKEYDVWKGTKHAQAWETLEKAEKDPSRYGWPVTAYPDCVACHVVGYGYKSGFINPTRTEHLKDVGCEECHGPGSAHADDPTKDNIVLGGPADCRRCHDFEQSPNFDYKARWKDIEHKMDR